ncbi:hypothetical protein, partial [Agrobacterium pusense]|uniref:hypothetical protein n=1 Tax=Agrobacterium pusense TaxID=648995 RepID=UPI0038505C65
MPLVIKPASFACRAERLARAGHGPDWPVVGPSGAAQTVGPDADPCEKVTLRVFSKVIWSNIDDTPGVHVAGCDMPGLDELAQPCGGEGIDFVIISRHPKTPSYFCGAG